jgi:hypothetical protein
MEIDQSYEAESEDLITELEAEDDGLSEPLPQSSFTPVNFSQASRRIIDLYRSYNEDKDLDPRPSFQRGYVWDRNKATKLIESILLHVPLPLVYTAEDQDGKEVVIDGQQRLTTCFSFIEGFFPPPKAEASQSVSRKPFRLGKMKILKELEGKSFKDLNQNNQQIIQKYNISVIKISKDSHPDVKFEIFERLNTGSVSLSDQEIRNCIFRGPYNELICELATTPQFRKLLGITSSAARMQDVELVLRFFAFHSATHLNYKDKMRAFLNNHMRENRFISPEKAEKYKKTFLNACELSYSVFGERAFRRFSEGGAKNPNGKWERSLNKAVFDCVMFWFARREKQEIIPSKDAIREAYIELCVSDREFQDSIMLGTADAQRVQTRFKKWEGVLEGLLGQSNQTRRTFTLSDKESFFTESPSCALCSQRIETLDDAEVDHILPFSKGGATELQNAQLTHRYCNRVKGDRG